uniref:Uncharacterized protein n=1 Tax=Arundo donax TaxID=35708 RepID=A0A0A9BYV9_ARUDO
MNDTDKYSYFAFWVWDSRHTDKQLDISMNKMHLRFQSAS